ncbi:MULTISPECIES: hypothetical protein [Kitasatospora]
MNAQPTSASQALSPDRFPLPQRHRRILACAAVAASIALGSLGVAATVETVRQDTLAISAPAR